MRHYFPAYLLTTLLLLTTLSAAEGQEYLQGRGWRGGRAGEMGPPPFGDYCPRRHADHYGARQPVETEEEAKKRLARFFELPPARILLRKELRNGYIADITSSDGSLFDRVMIDKRSGRIRSIR